jgi:hypothetical protein
MATPLTVVEMGKKGVRQRKDFFKNLKRNYITQWMHLFFAVANCYFISFSFLGSKLWLKLHGDEENGSGGDAGIGIPCKNPFTNAKPSRIAFTTQSFGH